MMIRLRKGRVVLIGIVIILVLFVLLSAIKGHMNEQNVKIGKYAKIIQQQQMRIEQLDSLNDNLEQINLKQHNDIRELQGSTSMNVSEAATVPTTETEEKDVNTDTKTSEETTKDGFNVVDSVMVGATAVGVFLGSTLKYVRMLPRVP